MPDKPFVLPDPDHTLADQHESVDDDAESREKVSHQSGRWLLYEPRLATCCRCGRGLGRLVLGTSGKHGYCDDHRNYPMRPNKKDRS